MTHGSEDRPDLRPLADPSGIVCGLAFDHRDSLHVLLRDLGLGLTHDEVAALKEVVVRAVAPLASAVMLDDDYGRWAIERGAVPPSVGLIMPLEAQGYAQPGDERLTTLLPGFSPELARVRGAVACKLLLPFRADRPSLVDHQLAVAGDAVAVTRAAGLAIVLEPQVYRLSTESPAMFAARVLSLTLAATEQLAAIGADLLKLPFPVLDTPGAPEGPDADARARDACSALSRATGGTRWVLYGAGVDTKTFAWQLRHAGAAGASGFLVGRTIWRDALSDDLQHAAATATRVCAPRFAEFAALAQEICRPLSSATTIA